MQNIFFLKIWYFFGFITYKFTYFKIATIVPQNETKKVTLAIKKQSDQSWLIAPYKECLPPFQTATCVALHFKTSTIIIFDQILFEEKQHWWKCRLYNYTKYLIMKTVKILWFKFNRYLGLPFRKKKLLGFIKHDFENSS
jgi:hypothetical protein